MKFLLLLYCPLLLGAIPLQIRTPETEVEISIYDLVRKGKKAPQLPKNFGEEVAKLLESNRTKMTDCLKLENLENTSMELALSLSASGKALANPVGKPTPSKSLQCILSVLSQISYPKHPFSKNVNVTFPLLLERKTL